MDKETLIRLLESDAEKDENGSNANIVDGLFAISRSIDMLSESIHKLGLNKAELGMGAIELLANELRDGLRNIADEIILKGK